MRYHSAFVTSDRCKHADSPFEFAVGLSRFAPIPHSLKDKPQTVGVHGQFLIESIVISFLGGVIGIALGIGISQAVSSLGGWDTIVSLQSILLAVGFSVAVGVFFGFYPANKAANLNPIDALRYE